MAKTDSIKTDFYINYLTQAQFDAAVTNNEIDADQLYLVPDTSITSVTAGTGLSGGGSSGAVTLNHSNSVTAKTTQGFYPITFDAQGHITGAGNAITPITSHNTAYLYVGTSSGNANAATTNGSTYFILVDGGSVTSRRKISGTQNVSVSSNSSGEVLITGPDLSSYALKSELPTDTNTWRTIQVDGTDKLGSAINTGKVNFKSGTNISLSYSSNAITINGPDLGNYALKSEIPTVSYPVTSVNSKTGAVSLTYSDVGAAASGHTHTTSIATSTATNQITLAYGTKYAITAGGTSYVFTMPSADDTNTWRTIQVNGTDILGSGTGTGKLNLKAGTGITLANSSGTVTITNSSTNTDTKVSTAAVTSGTTYYPVVGSDTTSAETKFYDKTGITYTGTNGTTSAVGVARLELGNSTASGSTNNKQGALRLYSTSTGYGDLVQTGVSSSVSVTHTFPAKSGTVAHTSDIPSVPTKAASATTGITASTTANKTTVSTGSSIYGVKSGTNSTTTASKASGSNGSASTWTFEEKSIPNVTSAGSASTWTFSGVTVANSIVGAVDANDSTQLNITLGTTTVQSKSGGGNGTAPTLGTAIKVQSKSGGGNGTAPSWSFTDVTVPIRADSATSIPSVSTATATVSITDPGHTHNLS